MTYYVILTGSKNLLNELIPILREKIIKVIQFEILFFIKAIHKYLLLFTLIWQVNLLVHKFSNFFYFLWLIDDVFIFVYQKKKFLMWCFQRWELVGAVLTLFRLVLMIFKSMFLPVFFMYTISLLLGPVWLFHNG